MGPVGITPFPLNSGGVYSIKWVIPENSSAKKITNDNIISPATSPIFFNVFIVERIWLWLKAVVVLNKLTRRYQEFIESQEKLDKKLNE